MGETMTYQDRYIAHQLRKKKVLKKLMIDRYSNRIFSDREVEHNKISELVDSIVMCPSSCDRRAISIEAITDRDKKALLGGLLVGGVGWIHRSPVVLLIFADQDAYKAGDEIMFMPFLDGGVVIYHLYLMAYFLDLSCCFVNPNVRKINHDHFKKVFGNKIFVGAMGVGYAV